MNRPKKKEHKDYCGYFRKCFETEKLANIGCTCGVSKYNQACDKWKKYHEQEMAEYASRTILKIEELKAKHKEELKAVIINSADFALKIKRILHKLKRKR